MRKLFRRAGGSITTSYGMYVGFVGDGYEVMLDVGTLDCSEPE